MKSYKIILTGATGMVGEGVLMHCLASSSVSEALVIGRRSLNLQDPKLKELIIKDFNQLSINDADFAKYDACFFCAGISSVGMNEEDYTKITYDTTLHFAKVLYQANPQLVFNFVSGSHTNIDGKQMWQRVKGKTEADLEQIGFKAVYNFRPGFMKPVKGQKNVKWFFKPMIAIFPILAPSLSLSLNEVGQAMINTIDHAYHTSILEIKDIKKLAHK